MRDLVEYIVKGLVDNPDQVVLNENKGEQMDIIEINVAEGDAGKVIGKEGRTINAIRTLVKAAAAKQDRRISVELMAK